VTTLRLANAMAKQIRLSVVCDVLVVHPYPTQGV